MYVTCYIIHNIVYRHSTDGLTQQNEQHIDEKWGFKPTEYTIRQ